jgi:hypothetical protein
MGKKIYTELQITLQVHYQTEQGTGMFFFLISDIPDILFFSDNSNKKNLSRGQYEFFFKVPTAKGKLCLKCKFFTVSQNPIY